MSNNPLSEEERVRKILHILNGELYVGQKVRSRIWGTGKIAIITYLDPSKDHKASGYIGRIHIPDGNTWWWFCNGDVEPL